MKHKSKVYSNDHEDWSRVTDARQVDGVAPKEQTLLSYERHQF